MVSRTDTLKENLRPRKFQLILDDNQQETLEYQPGYRWEGLNENDFKVQFIEELGDELSTGKHQLTMKDIEGEINLNELIIIDNPGVFFEPFWQRQQ